MFSLFDEVIGFGDMIYGLYTSEFPTQDKSVMYETSDYTHLALRDNTVKE